MFGIMKKDFKLIKKQLLIIAGIMVFYVLIMGMGKTRDYQLGMFGGYTVAFMAILPVTMLGYEEKYKWGKYSSAMPVSRKETVISKFLVMLLLILAIDAVFGIYAAFTGIGSAAATLITVGALSLTTGSVILTIAYKFGTEKARIIFVALVFTIMLILMAITGNRLTSADIDNLLKMFHGVSKTTVTGMTAALGALIYAACMMISVHIYSKKDL